jgi:O-glycosyl hydrolase
MDMEFTAHPYHNHFNSEELREVHKEAAAEFKKYAVDFHSSEWCLLPTSKQYGGITADWAKGNHGDIQAALMMARIMHSDFVDTDAVSWCYWKGMELRGDHALIALHATDGDIHKGGYVTANKLLWGLGNFSRFVRPGYVRVALDGADDLDTLAGTAFLAPDGSRLVMVFVNSSFEDVNVDIALPKKYAKKVQQVDSYRTDARHDLAKTITGKGTVHTIGARGLTTIVLDF